jgi:hypothetical protein
MYTFGILAAFFFLLSGAIFGKRIKQNQPLIALIVITGTLIGSIIVNGILGLSIPYQDVHVKTKALSEGRSIIYTPEDTASFVSYIKYYYNLKEGREKPGSNYLDIGVFEDIYVYRQGKMQIEFLEEGDSIPRLEIFRAKRLTDNKWVAQFGLPSGGRSYVVHIPNDSIHNVLMDHLNDKFYNEDEDTKIAQSN